MFYVAYIYYLILVMFCALNFYFVDFNGIFTSSPTWHLKMHGLRKVGKNVIFQNKTLGLLVNVLPDIIRHFVTNFVILNKHFLKANNSEDSLACSCEEF